MKKIAIGLLALTLVFLTLGCGVRQGLEKKAGEGLVEKILGDAGINADIDEDQMIIKGEDGQVMTIGGGQWPSSALAKSIPEFKGGKITSMVEADDSLLILVEEVSEESFAAYLEEVKETFSQETYQLSTETGMMYAAENGKNSSVVLTYEEEAGLSIAVTQAAE